MNVSAQKFLLIFATGLILFGSTGCGKRKAPQPPTERVVQRVSVDGNQVGNRIDLVWRMPARNAGDASTLNIDRVDIYRLAEPLDASLTLNEEQFSARSTRIASVPVTDSDFGLKNMVYSDQLSLAGQPVRLRYAIRFANKSGQQAAFSNFFLIEPVANIAPAPTGFSLTAGQAGVTLSWTEPARNADGSEPVNLSGFNIYRSTAGEGPALLNEKPVRPGTYVDDNAEFGKEYRYYLRSVSVGRNGEDVESFNSETLSVKNTDTFAPKPPEALTIASAPGIVSIFFAFNTETDIKGYKVFRSTDRTTPLDRWKLLTEKELTENTFQDKTASSGTRYWYYVIAVDNAGNKSDPSEIVSETAL